MFIRLGNNYNVSLLVEDINGIRITNDSPYTIIKNVGNGAYWNGISWVNLEFRIYLEHVMNGVYRYNFIPDVAGLYEIVTKSDAYQISKTETLEAYEKDFASYAWTINSEFTVKYPVTDINIIPQISIYKEMSKMYWDNTSWISTPTIFPMPAIEGGIAIYTFIPDEEEEYCITIIDNDEETFMKIQATAIADNVSPVVITSASLKSLDGTDCILMATSHDPLSGVKISAYDQVSKVLISQTASDSSGKWSMVVKPGKYYFVFEKEGYTPIGMQRTVS
jgi:hypothetical protein